MEHACKPEQQPASSQSETGQPCNQQQQPAYFPWGFPWGMQYPAPPPEFMQHQWAMLHFLSSPEIKARILPELQKIGWHLLVLLDFNVLQHLVQKFLIVLAVK